MLKKSRIMSVIKQEKLNNMSDKRQVRSKKQLNKPKTMKDKKLRRLKELEDKPMEIQNNLWAKKWKKQVILFQIKDKKLSNT
jgi:hypothetical protein